MSKHLVFVVTPGHGHVNPTLPLVEELVARGHRVTYVTGARLLPAVAARPRGTTSSASTRVTRSGPSTAISNSGIAVAELPVARRLVATKAPPDLMSGSARA